MHPYSIWIRNSIYLLSSIGDRGQIVLTANGNLDPPPFSQILISGPRYGFSRTIIMIKIIAETVNFLKVMTNVIETDQGLT